MELTKKLYTDLLEQAKDNPRLRQAMDLRTTSDDQSQRLLNVLLREQLFLSTVILQPQKLPSSSMAALTKSITTTMATRPLATPSM